MKLYVRTVCTAVVIAKRRMPVPQTLNPPTYRVSEGSKAQCRTPLQTALFTEYGAKSFVCTQYDNESYVVLVAPLRRTAALPVMDAE